MAASYLDVMERHCAAFMARLGDGGTFDLPQEMNALVLGIIMEAFLGADFVRHMPPTVASDFRDFIRGLDPILLQHYELTLTGTDPVPVPTPAFKGPRSPCLIRYQAKPGCSSTTSC